MAQPSSTSSSEERRALRVDVLVTLAFVVAVLGAAEFGFRTVVPNLSANSRTLAAAPQRAQAIREFEGTSVLILGNSISGDGIVAESLQESLGEEVLIAHQPADSSVMRDWYYELKNHFYLEQAAPTWVVLPVGDTHPLTRVNQRTEDLMFSFVSWSDLPTFFDRSEAAADAQREAMEMPRDLRRGERLEERLGVILGKASALYGFRGRVQKRIMVTIAPRYDELRYEMRSAGVATDGTHDVSTDPLWTELVAEITVSNSTSVLVIAMPSEPLESALSGEDLAIIEQYGWHVIAPGLGDAWSDEDRPDGLHLSHEAADRFTALLAPELDAVISAGAE